MALVLAIFTLIGERSLEGFEKIGELFKNTRDKLSSKYEKIAKMFKYNPLDKITAIFTGIKNAISKVTIKVSNQFAYGGAALACAFGIYEITQLCNITTDSYVDFLVGYVGFTFGITFGKIVFNIVRAIIERKAPEEPRVINARAVQGFVFSKYFPDPVSFRVPDNCPRWLKKILLWGPHHYNYRTIVLVSAKGRADDMKLECIEKPKEFEEYINSKQAQPKEVAFYTANQE